MIGPDDRPQEPEEAVAVARLEVATHEEVQQLATRQDLADLAASAGVCIPLESTVRNGSAASRRYRSEVSKGSNSCLTNKHYIRLDRSPARSSVRALGQQVRTAAPGLRVIRRPQRPSGDRAPAARRIRRSQSRVVQPHVDAGEVPSPPMTDVALRAGGTRSARTCSPGSSPRARRS